MTWLAVPGGGGAAVGGKVAKMHPGRVREALCGLVMQIRLSGSKSALGAAREQVLPVWTGHG
jgi:hypothetical protein